VRYQKFYNLSNPPILVRKEAFVTANYPHYAKFAKLTRQENKLGILDSCVVKKHQEWVKCLEENCVRIKGHSLFWRSDADPEKLKILQTTASERQTRKN
jgi:hypothetical protein